MREAGPTSRLVQAPPLPAKGFAGIGRRMMEKGPRLRRPAALIATLSTGTAMPKKILTSIAELHEAGLVASGDHAALERVASRFPVRLTTAVLDTIVSAGDAVARQFLPDGRENDIRSWEEADPIADRPHAPVKGVVHRYPDRALLKLTASCPVHCRFCFRREMIGPASTDTLSEAELDAALAYLAATPSIWEVVVSGGDPLALSPRRLSRVVAKLDAIDHVAVIRWHTRVPVVDPQAVTPDLVEALVATNKAVYIAVHTNHAAEHTGAVRDACRRLRRAGIVLVGQSVLLRGVNDSPEALEALMRSCVALGIKPYYLHLLDRARGTSHFRVPLAEAVGLVAALRGRVSGLCQPSLMLDLPGGFGKVAIPTAHVVAHGGGRYTIRDFLGRDHDYRDPAEADPKSLVPGDR